MKTIIKRVGEERAFKPFAFSIVIETPEEARELRDVIFDQDFFDELAYNRIKTELISQEL